MSDRDTEISAQPRLDAAFCWAGTPYLTSGGRHWYFSRRAGVGWVGGEQVYRESAEAIMRTFPRCREIPALRVLLLTGGFPGGLRLL